MSTTLPNVGVTFCHQGLPKPCLLSLCLRKACTVPGEPVCCSDTHNIPTHGHGVICGECRVAFHASTICMFDGEQQSCAHATVRLITNLQSRQQLLSFWYLTLVKQPHHVLKHKFVCTCLVAHTVWALMLSWQVAFVYPSTSSHRLTLRICRHKAV